MDVELELWRDAVHGFQIAPFLPEAALAIDDIVKFIAARTGWQTRGPAPQSTLPPVAGAYP